MKLFLASEAKHPKSLERLETFVGSFKNKSMAFIPTALNGNHRYGEWKTKSATWKKVNKLGMKVTVVSLEEYRNKSVIKALEGKDIIWFTGGATGYLLYWIRRCELDRYLPGVLGNGSVFVGSSAGSMICSRTEMLAELYIDETEPGASIFPGLGFVDFEIYPHYKESLLPQLKRLWKKEYGDLYLLKDGEAITVVEGKVELLGKTRMLRNGKIVT